MNAIFCNQEWTFIGESKDTHKQMKGDLVRLSNLAIIQVDQVIDVGITCEKEIVYFIIMMNFSFE